MISMIVALALAANVLFTTIARGSASGQVTPRQVTVQDPDEWNALWKTHAPAQKLPAVDFSTQTVVGVFLGSRPSAGFNVEIVSVQTGDAALVVEYAERRPGRDMIAAQVLTEPFHLVAVPKHTGPVRFVRIDAPPR